MSSNPARSTAVALVAAAVAVSACRRPSEAAGARAAASCPANAPRAKLDFTLKDLDGRPVRLADYRGKVLLLDFWATWCGPCKIEIPAFVELYDAYRSRGFEVVGAVALDRFANVKPFARQMRMNYTIVDAVDRDDIDEAFGPLVGLPTSFLISRDGRICVKHIGLPAANDVRAVFEAELKALL